MISKTIGFRGTLFSEHCEQVLVNSGEQLTRVIDSH